MFSIESVPSFFDIITDLSRSPQSALTYSTRFESSRCSVGSLVLLTDLISWYPELRLYTSLTDLRCRRPLCFLAMTSTQLYDFITFQHVLTFCIDECFYGLIIIQTKSNQCSGLPHFVKIKKNKLLLLNSMLYRSKALTE